MNLEKTCKNLINNNYNVIVLESKDELLPLLDTIIIDNSRVNVGGSMTLFETNVIDYLQTRDINFDNRYEDGLTSEQIDKVNKNAIFADYYLTSSNAITSDGYLVNMDGRGNRVASMIYGPNNVLVIAGINKIVEDEKEAIKRIKEIAAPLNTKRLNMGTPCVTLGKCVDCNHTNKICRNYVRMGKQLVKDRITIIFIKEELGY